MIELNKPARQITTGLAAVLFLFFAGMEQSYAAGTESSILYQNSNAIIVSDVRTFELRDIGRGRLEVNKEVKILNRDGAHHADFRLYYNSFTDISRVRIELYNSEGERLERIRTRDMDDSAVMSGFSTYDDTRMKNYRFHHDSYPYTVKLEYRIDYNGFIQPPPWVPVYSEKTSVKEAIYRVELPRDQPMLFYRAFSLPDEALEIEHYPEGALYTWRIENLPGVEREVMGPPAHELFPAVTVRFHHFRIERNSGTMRTWDEFGRWFGELWDGRDELPGHIKEQIDTVLEKTDDRNEIIRNVYSHIQTTTRYVSIQLGIGGLQTETAQATVRNSYGDCKALTNYLLAMLRYAGIEAYPALIRNGSFHFPFDPEFVHDPFNHVVVYIPPEEDGDEPVWIEATSSSLPAGYIGSSNANRHALVFHKDWAELVETPRLTTEDNFQVREAAVRLEENGNASVQFSTLYGGWQHERIRNLTRQLAGAKNRSISDMIPYNNFEIHTSEINPDSELAEARLSLKLDIQSYAITAGNRLIFYPNMLERRRSQLSSNPDRIYPVYIRNAFHDEDNFVYRLPEGYGIELLPESASLEFEYGSYQADFSFDEETGEVHYTRSLTMWPGILPADRFDEYREFINRIVTLDGGRVIAVKN